MISLVLVVTSKFFCVLDILDIIRLGILFNLFFFFFGSSYSKRPNQGVCAALPSMPAKIGHQLYYLVAAGLGG